ncbi:MAG: ATP-binding cassette domain-containing protein, partial [Bacteroidota bacterium]
MLSLQNVTITIGAKTLLEEVSLDVRPGEVVALVGSNGAGKTTALKVLSGEWQPRSGQALLEGKPMTDWTSQALATRRAIVSQSTTIPFEFLAAEVVLLGRTPHQTTRAHDIDVAERALHAAGVLHLAARRYTTLSGGEKQRVQIARALAQIEGADTASYLLLDEPTSALDIAHQQLALHLVREVATQNVGVLAILHD